MTDQNVEKGAAKTGDGDSSGMPSLKALATAAFYANAPFLAYFLLTKDLHTALSIAGGYLVGMVLNGILYFIVNQGPSLVGHGYTNPSPQQKFGQSGGFMGLTAGKFLITGGLMFVLIVLLKLNVYLIAGGFLLTQTAVALTVLKGLRRTQLLR